MSNEKINEIKRKVEEIQAKYRSDVSTLQDQIRTLNEKIDLENKKKALFADQLELDRLKEADDVIQDLQRRKTLYKEQLEKLMTGSVISKAQYETLTAALYAEVVPLAKDLRREFAEMSEQMYEKAMVLQDLQNEVNPLLRTLQHDIYRDNDRVIGRNGKRLFLTGENKEINEWDTVRWGMICINSYQYNNYLRSMKDDEKKDGGQK